MSPTVPEPRSADAPEPGGAGGPGGADFADPAGSDPAGSQPAGGSFAALWAELEPIGRDRRTGGYRRYSWTGADQECREWFRAAAAARGLTADEDGNGNLWAWWG